MSWRCHSDFTGNSSLCTIDEGVYYINGYFVGVNKQVTVIGKYTDDTSNCILIIQNLNTLEMEKIKISQLSNDMDLWSKFCPQDIFMVGYVIGQQQILLEKKWLRLNS